MNFSFLITFFQKVCSMVQTLWNWFGNTFSMFGVKGSYSILALLGGVGRVALIVYSVLKP